MTHPAFKYILRYLIFVGVPYLLAIIQILNLDYANLQTSA
jgi:hypothetical protein